MTATAPDRPALAVVAQDEPPVELPAGTSGAVDAPNAHNTRVRVREAPVVRRAVAVVRPPDMFRADYPSLTKLWHDGIWGAQVPAHGFWRWVKVGWFLLVAFPAAVVGIGWTWVHERPSRAAIGYLTLWAVCQLPPVAAVLHFLAWLATWPARHVS